MEQERKNLKVLIVDDSEKDRKVLESKLLQLGFQDVLKARQGTEALEMARKHLPDLIFLDILMPGLDGGAVRQVLKEDPKTKDIPTIFLSSIISQKEQKGLRGLTGGGDIIMAKPASTEELSEAINKALNR